MKYIISYRLTGKLAEKAVVTAPDIAVAVDMLLEELEAKKALDKVEYIGVIKQDTDWENPAAV